MLKIRKIPQSSLLLKSSLKRRNYPAIPSSKTDAPEVVPLLFVVGLTCAAFGYWMGSKFVDPLDS